MRMMFHMTIPAALLVLLAGFVASALALSAEQSAVLFEESATYAKEELRKACELPEDQRRPVYEAVVERIETNLALCGGAADGVPQTVVPGGGPSACALAGWGELYMHLAQKTPGDAAFIFLDKAAPIFEKACKLNSMEEHALAGAAAVHCIRAERLADAGKAEESRRQAEAGFAAFQEGVRRLPNSAFLHFMWGGNLALRAHDAKDAERRALRQEGLEKLARAAELDPTNHRAMRMAGTICLRMAGELPAAAADERNALLAQAESWYKKAFALDAGGTCRYLAKAQAMRKDPDGLRITLEQCARNGRLPDLGKDAYNFVRDQEWFRHLAAESR